MIDIRDYLVDNILMFDGGMGTYLSEKNHQAGMSCELANLSQPDLVAEIHREYLEAGCKAIKTNSFASNRIVYQGDTDLVERTINASWALAAKEAENFDAYVFADIGPVTNLPDDQSSFEEYKYVVDLFVKNGASNFLFETNSNTEGLKEIASYIKNIKADSYIITSFAVSADGYTRDGIMVNDLFEDIRHCESIDAIGMNCVCGARHMLELISDVDIDGLQVALMPNAGYPMVINNRTFYDGDPYYFAAQLKEMAHQGVKILGGCCGTMPLHIRTTLDMLGDSRQISSEKKGRREKNLVDEKLESPFWNKLQSRQKVFAVELDSPADVRLSKFMSGAWELKGAGCDIITIADCPIARARMDSSILACKIKRELNIDALPHMTCRDRNLNATKALLLGLYAEGIRNVLLITGDPIPTAERDEVKSVYQFNSRKLASFVNSLSKKHLPGHFHLFGALNVNAVNFDVQLRLAKEKQEKGMIGFLTQPILTMEAFENLKRAREELDGYILGGVIPVVSERNARFMDSEINGINVDPEIIEAYKGKNREECEKLAIDISVDIMKNIAPYVDGYYLMTPFGRTKLISDIMKEFKN